MHGCDRLSRACTQVPKETSLAWLSCNAAGKQELQPPAPYDALQLCETVTNPGDCWQSDCVITCRRLDRLQEWDSVKGIAWRKGYSWVTEGRTVLVSNLA